MTAKFVHYMLAIGPKPKRRDVRDFVAIGWKADILAIGQTRPILSTSPAGRRPQRLANHGSFT